MPIDRPDATVRAPLLLLLAACSTCLIACRTPPPPFSVPQPTPDWSDPEKQGRVSVEAVSCEDAWPSKTNPGCWRLILRFRVLGNSAEVAGFVAHGITFGICGVAPYAVVLHEVGGPGIRLRVPRSNWNPFIRPIDFDPVFPECPQQLPSGEWETVVPAVIYAERQPVGEVELSIDGEALRRELTIEGEERRSPARIPASIPIGGLTGKSAKFSVPAPAPAPDSPNSAPTAGAGIAGSP